MRIKKKELRVNGPSSPDDVVGREFNQALSVGRMEACSGVIVLYMYVYCIRSKQQ